MSLTRTDFEVSRWSGCNPNHPGDPATLQLVFNMFCPLPDNSNYTQRPGFRAMGTVSGQPLNEVPQPTTNIESQAAGSFVTLAGVTHNFYVAAGEIYDDATGLLVFARRIVTGDYTGATNGAVTVKTSGLIYWCEYNGQVVFNDGTNQPFMWNGTSGGGLTLLDNAPATAIGRPVAYYGKLFFIKTGNTLVWSEENAPNTGYEADGYNNTWDLRQTSGEPIIAIVGTNDALYYFRPSSIGRITGAVTPDFATTGTDDGVSDLYGTVSYLGAEKITGNTIAFGDQYGRPCLVADGVVVPIYKQCIDATLPEAQRMDDRPVRSVPAVGLTGVARYASNVFIGHQVGYGVVLFGNGGINAEYMFAFNAETWKLQGWWFAEYSGSGSENSWRATGQGYNTTGATAGQVGGRSPLLFLVPYDTTYGKVARIEYADDDSNQVTVWSSASNYSPLVLTHEIPSRANTINYHFEEIEITFSAKSAGTMNVRYWTSDVSSYPAVQAVATAAYDNRVRVGINGFGRWIIVRLDPEYRTAASDGNFNLESIRVVGYAADREGASKSR